MSVLNQFDVLFHTGIELVRGVSGHWQLNIFNPDTRRLEPVGGIGTGGSPLLAPGLDKKPVIELLVLAGDPPDALTMAGDVVYLRQWMPTFLGTHDADIVGT